MTLDLLKAFILGVVEGLTEFVPVSSTGHLLLVQRFFGFADDEFGKTFAVLIQFGAILALLSIYFFKLWRLATTMFSDPDAQIGRAHAELQSLTNLVCRLLLEKKKKKPVCHTITITKNKKLLNNKKTTL